MGHGSWPLGFGILDVAVPAVGILIVLVLVIGFIALLVKGSKHGDHESPLDDTMGSDSAAGKDEFYP